MVNDLYVCPGANGARGSEVAWFSPEAGTYTLFAERLMPSGISVVRAVRYACMVRKDEEDVIGLPTEGGHIAQWQHFSNDPIEGSLTEYGLGVDARVAAAHLLRDLADYDGSIVPVEAVRGPKRAPVRDVKLTPLHGKPQPVGARSADKPYIAVAAR